MGDAASSFEMTRLSGVQYPDKIDNLSNEILENTLLLKMSRRLIKF